MRKTDVEINCHIIHYRSLLSAFCHYYVTVIGIINYRFIANDYG